jgi:hypothetical protein
LLFDGESANGLIVNFVKLFNQAGFLAIGELVGV